MLNYHVQLTIFLYGSDHTEYTEKANLRKMKINATKVRAVEINFIATGMNGGNMLSILEVRSINVVRQAGSLTSDTL